MRTGMRMRIESWGLEGGGVSFMKGRLDYLGRIVSGGIVAANHAMCLNREFVFTRVGFYTFSSYCWSSHQMYGIYAWTRFAMR